MYRREPANGLVRIGTATGLTNAWGVRVRGTTAFVTDGMEGLAILDVSDPAKARLISRMATGGQARGVALDGDTAYVAAGSAGLVIVDISRLGSPRVIGRAEVPGSAIRVDYSAGRAYVAAWNDARVYDVSSPAAPRFIASARMTRDISSDDDGRPEVTSRTLGVAAAGDVMFAGNWHIIHSFRVFPDRRSPSLLLPEDVNLIDFGPVAPGGSASVPLVVRNQGTAPLTLISASTSNSAFTVEPRRAEIAPTQTATLTLSYRASSADRTTAFLDLVTDDPLNRNRRGYLVANQPGLGVGKPLPDTTVALVDGGTWSSTEAKGQVMLMAYFATF
jgi:hypothetical protein